jgi:hypothetical protein
MRKLQRAKYCFAKPRGIGIGTSLSPYVAKVDMTILGVGKWNDSGGGLGLGQTNQSELPGLTIVTRSWTKA